MSEPVSDTRINAESPDVSTSQAPSVVQHRLSSAAKQQRQTGSTAQAKTLIAPRNLRPRLDRRLLLMSLIAGFPALLIAMIMLWSGSYTAKVQWTLSVIMVGF